MWSPHMCNVTTPLTDVRIFVVDATDVHDSHRGMRFYNWRKMRYKCLRIENEKERNGIQGASAFLNAFVNHCRKFTVNNVFFLIISLLESLIT